jgi:hypothetical protein
MNRILFSILDFLFRPRGQRIAVSAVSWFPPRVRKAGSVAMPPVFIMIGTFVILFPVVDALGPIRGLQVGLILLLAPTFAWNEYLRPKAFTAVEESAVRMQLSKMQVPTIGSQSVTLRDYPWIRLDAMALSS